MPQTIYDGSGPNNYIDSVYVSVGGLNILGYQYFQCHPTMDAVHGSEQIEGCGV